MRTKAERVRPGYDQPNPRKMPEAVSRRKQQAQVRFTRKELTSTTGYFTFGCGRNFSYNRKIALKDFKRNVN
ncbi:hypothetical protein KIN20_035655 [Parelaphostrongylus tenuis]|uniref:Uncharacterized protein n=1 Tax=Parelaphostrongylus tenuis TaxID=148309 RepID=A0AAD5WJV9_PARTN|nr:hypothetical protein KIN20_035655 [Parelaphostrongylus tenuis]